MKKMILAAAIVTAFAVTALAQTPTPPSRPASTAGGATAAPGGGGTGVEGKVAYINTAAFRQGINELKVKLDGLNGEFEPKRKEVQSLEEQINNLKNKIQTQGGTVSVQVRSQWAEEAAELEKTYKRKAEDYDAFGQKRLAELSQPTYDKVGKFLEGYCQQRGIVMVLEGGAAAQAGIILFAAQATDITDDFMKAYNAANGGGAGPAAPGAKKP